MVQTLNTVHSLKGENLLHGTPLVEWADLLTAAGVEGCVTPEELWELVAMSCLS